jgi:hypothetical protein
MKARFPAIVLLTTVALVLPGTLFAHEKGPALQPGDTVGQMVLDTGMANVDTEAGMVPIWAFCPSGFGDADVTTVECVVPAFPALGIGHGFFAADEEYRAAGWEALTWELYLDGNQVDLDSFGYFDQDLPWTGVPGRNPDEEVIVKLRSWDVAVRNPAQGEHTLRSVLHLSEQVDDGYAVYDPGTFELVVNFTIAPAPPAEGLPETGGPSPAGFQLRALVGGLLALVVGLGLKRVHGRLH